MDEHPTWTAYAAAMDRGETGLEARLARDRRVVAEDECSDWGWCVRCRRAWLPSHRCYVPR